MEEIALNIVPTGVRPVCHVSQYDVGREIKVNLFNGNAIYTLQANDSLVINIKKPNGENVSGYLTANMGQTFSYIVTTEEMCDIAGVNECELRLKNNDMNIGTLNFKINVEEIVGDVDPLPPPTPPTPPTPKTNFKITDINYELEVINL